MEKSPLQVEKVLIVEGRTDKEQVERVLQEPVQIICTQGSYDMERLEEEILPFEGAELYILVDADEAGNKLRQQLKRELPNAKHLYTRKMYGEVACTPLSYLAKILADAHFLVRYEHLQGNHGFNRS